MTEVGVEAVNVGWEVREVCARSGSCGVVIPFIVLDLSGAVVAFASILAQLVQGNQGQVNLIPPYLNQPP